MAYSMLNRFALESQSTGWPDQRTSAESCAPDKTTVSALSPNMLTRHCMAPFKEFGDKHDRLTFYRTVAMQLLIAHIRLLLSVTAAWPCPRQLWLEIAEAVL